jgi:transglutaminase-like putative cysteine protease
MRRRRARLGGSVLVLALMAVPALEPAVARPAGPILHERIPPDPREDLALNAVLDGDLPAALQTPSGIVQAPDPRQLPHPTDPAYGPNSGHDTFVPDRETSRPEVSSYDEPFTPSTAPFKRLEAFDGVRSDFTLYVRDPHLVQMSTGASPRPDDALFYADLVVDVDPDRTVRIPSVGPGARVARAHLGIGAEDVPMRVMRDGADNWFVQIRRPRGPIRARLVMEIVIPRVAFGGQLGDPPWSDLPPVPPLPDDVAREAAAVRSAIGVNRRMRPRQAIAKLVQYFRGFVDANDPPRGRGSIYLDLALSKKGVCRHRAFAFLVTAQGLGIPTRMILNEAHAWVEVHDGTLWRRIDLGGAGRLSSVASDATAERAAYEMPADAFAWPQNAQRGGDMLADARRRGSRSGAGAGSPAEASTTEEGGASPGGSVPAASTKDSLHTSGEDDRPASTIALAGVAPEAHRGLPLTVRGNVLAGGEPCPHVAVELWLRAAATHKTFRLGTLATGNDGAFGGGIVVPPAAALGDYDVIARTPGDAHCGSGGTD